MPPLIKVGDLKQWLKENHEPLHDKYEHWLTVYAYKPLETQLAWACGKGLFDLCAVLGLDTAWYSVYLGYYDPYSYKRYRVVPEIMNELAKVTTNRD
jgi:hypothetical protein